MEGSNNLDDVKNVLNTKRCTRSGTIVKVEPYEQSQVDLSNGYRIWKKRKLNTEKDIEVPLTHSTNINVGTPRDRGDGPTFKEGDLVFAKIKGHPAWPARVSSAADDKGLKYHVFFYGTYETAVVHRDTIWLYNQETKKNTA